MKQSRVLGWVLNNIRETTMKKFDIHRTRIMAVFACALAGAAQAADLAVTRAPFATMPDGAEIDVYTLTNENGIKIRVINYGAIVLSIETPDVNGDFADIVLGYDTLASYLEATPYFGAVVGRYGNRIANGTFTLDGKTYTLAKNDGDNALHGGNVGFDKVVWEAKALKEKQRVGVELHYLSKDGEEGYPGNLDVTVRYWLDNQDAWTIEYEATTDKATPVNLTQHTYWNLAGHDSGDILGHQLRLFADRFTPVDKGLITTGELRPVAGTPMDFTNMKAIGKEINAATEQLKFGLGYDHNWVLSSKTDQKSGLRMAARVVEPKSGRVLNVRTEEPGIQFYCGNFLDGTNIGKGGHAYQYRNGFCLETQHYPDSPNKPDFPSTILKPGEKYETRTVYQFTTTATS